MDNMKHRRLQELDRSDFEIVREDPDIRGWDVRGINGRKVGAVEDLIVDAQEKKVRYMVVDLDDNELKLRHRKVLIPIGLAELDQKDDDVLIPNISAQQLGELPDYDRDSLTADLERTIFSALNTRTEPTGVEPPKPIVDTDAERKATLEREERKNRLEKEEGRKERERIEDRKNRLEKEERKEMARDEKWERKKGEEHDEVDPDFYRHEYYNLDNLYKNRLHEAKPVEKKRESEYERGLRLWERRSEGAVIPDDKRRESTSQPARGTGGYRELDEEQRMELIRDRRNNYQQRRYPDRERSNVRRENEIERREDEDLGSR
jgi:sporulation protein YlmC with PRC-barrel domain